MESRLSLKSFFCKDQERGLKPTVGLLSVVLVARKKSIEFDILLQ